MPSDFEDVAETGNFVCACYFYYYKMYEYHVNCSTLSYINNVIQSIISYFRDFLLLDCLTTETESMLFSLLISIPN